MTETRTLLLRWYGGDAEALAALVQQDAGWIETHVRRRLGSLLRRRDDTQDIVQSTLVEVLRDGPRFVVSDRGHLRALLARMVENVLRGKASFHTADKRDVRRDVELRAAPSETLLDLDVPAGATPPERAAERSETREWVRLALEFLDPADRDSIVWRDYDELPFAEIGQRLGVAEDAARMRYRRALPKLARALAELRGGRVESLL